jgi:hypothetical protein
VIPVFQSGPKLTDGSLPTGIYWTDLREFKERFVTSTNRSYIFEGFIQAALLLRQAGCGRLIIGGSFITDKLLPGDIDVIWDTVGINLAILDPIFLDDSRQFELAQRYLGDYLPGIAGHPDSCSLVKYFSKDKKTGAAKGLIGLKPSMIELLNP